jgi:hypothetical protein
MIQNRDAKWTYQAVVAREKGGKKDVKMSNESPVQTVAEASPSNVAAFDEEDRREQ